MTSQTFRLESIPRPEAAKLKALFLNSVLTEAEAETSVVEERKDKEIKRTQA